MLLRNLTLSGSRSVHTVRVSTIYQFVTVFNHSDHAVTVFPENLTLDNDKHYRVPPRIYLTLPLIGAGMVESCQREVVYTVISEGVDISPTIIGLSFTEENNNINMPFPDLSIPNVANLFSSPASQDQAPVEPCLIIPNQILPIPLPVQITNPILTTAIAGSLKRDLIPSVGDGNAGDTQNIDLVIGGSRIFIIDTSHVTKFTALITTVFNANITIEETVQTKGHLTPRYVSLHTQAILGNILIPTMITGVFNGNMARITIINNASQANSVAFDLIGYN